MELLKGLKDFFIGSAPIVGPLMTAAVIYLWLRVGKLQDLLIAASEKHGEDLKSVTADFAKQLDAVQAEHVETAKGSLQIVGALEPLIRDVREELLRRGRKSSTPAGKEVVP